MTEVKAEGNILNPKKYPEIADNTISFVVPYNTEQDKEIAIKRMSVVFEKKQLDTLKLLKLKHHFNGYFLVFQKDLLNNRLIDKNQSNPPFPPLAKGGSRGI
jgi:hypothetical protein